MGLLLLGVFLIILILFSVVNFILPMVIAQQAVQPDRFLLSKGSLRTFVQGHSLAKSSSIAVFSNNIENNSGLLDFGQVPVISNIPDFMKFMPPYQAIFYVTNLANHNVSISSINITNVQSPQGLSPFNFCGLDYNKTSIRLPPGYSQTLSICFFPNKTGASNALMMFFSGSDNIFRVPISGNAVAPASSSSTDSESMAFIQPTIHEDNVIRNTSHLVVPSFNSLSTVQTMSPFIKTMTPCSVVTIGRFEAFPESLYFSFRLK